MLSHSVTLARAGSSRLGHKLGSVNSANQPRGAAEDMRERLRGALRAAMRARDTAAASALRTALAAIANAEAIPVSDSAAAATTSPHFAGAAAGLGAAEAERRSLTDDEVRLIVRAEIDERLAAAADYERHGHAGHADRLRREAQALGDLTQPDR